MTNWDLLKPYFYDIQHPDELIVLELLPILEKFLNEEQRAGLEVMGPASLVLPDGSSIELEYKADGAQPRLEICLQDVLGWQESPKVDDGEKTVELYLLNRS